MKKKVVVTYEDGGELTYRGYADKDDNYFIAFHRFSLEVVKITRQYYPLKDHKAEVIFDRENIGDVNTNEIRKAMKSIVKEITNKLERGDFKSE